MWRSYCPVDYEKKDYKQCIHECFTEYFPSSKINYTKVDTCSPIQHDELLWH